MRILVFNTLFIILIFIIFLYPNIFIIKKIKYLVNQFFKTLIK